MMETLITIVAPIIAGVVGIYLLFERFFGKCNCGDSVKYFYKDYGAKHWRCMNCHKLRIDLDEEATK